MSQQTRISRGILFVVLATLCFVVMNVMAKVMTPHLPTVEIIWARTLGHLIVVIALFAPGHGGWRLLVTRRPAIQATRSLLLLTSTSFFFSALGSSSAGRRHGGVVHLSVPGRRAGHARAR